MTKKRITKTGASIMASGLKFQITKHKNQTNLKSQKKE